MFKWAKLMLENGKVVISLLVILLSSLGFSGWTIVDQQQELTELKHPPVPVQVIEVTHPVNSGLKELKIDVEALKRWHE